MEEEPNGTPAANSLNMGFCVNVAGQVAGKPRSYYGEENYGNTADKWNYFASEVIRLSSLDITLAQQIS